MAVKDSFDGRWELGRKKKEGGSEEVVDGEKRKMNLELLNVGDDDDDGFEMREKSRWG